MTLKIDVKDAKRILVLLVAANELDMSNQTLNRIHDEIKVQVEKWDAEHPNK